jgi:hypothetical protein
MVKIAPNSAQVRGTVTGVEDTGDPSGFLEVTIRVADIGSLPRSRNMFEQQPGEVVKVLMAPALVESLAVRDGVEVEAEIRRADLHRSFVNPKTVRVGTAEDEGSGEEDRIENDDRSSEDDVSARTEPPADGEDTDPAPTDEAPDPESDGGT